MADAYRAVVIGGGVGGASIAYHLTELGWQDVLLVDRSELTSGSTFHSAGLVGQLRSSVSLTRMMMYGAELYRRLGAETGVDPGWHEVGSLRLASSRRADAGAPPAGGLGAHVRPAARGHLHGGRAREVPAVRSGRRAGRGVHPDGRAPGSDEPDARAGGGRPPSGCGDPDQHQGHRHRRAERSRPRDPDAGARPDRGGRRGERRRDLREPDRSHGGRRGADRPVRASVPADETRRGRQRGPADDARSGPTGLLPRRGRWRSGDGGIRTEPGAVGGGGRTARRLQPSAPARRLGAVRTARRERVRAGAGAADRRGRHDDQRPGGVHARRRVHPGRVRRPRVLRGRRVLCARDRGGRRDRQGHGGLDRARRAGVRPVEDGHPPVRRAVPVAALRPRASGRGLLDVLRHPLPR